VVPLKDCTESRYFVSDHWISAAAPDTELERALHLDELEVAYQPIVDFSGSLVCGAEALLRWNHPQAGLLWPSDFLPLVVDEQLIVRIVGRGSSSCRRRSQMAPRVRDQKLTIAVKLVAAIISNAVDLASHLANLVHSFGFEREVLALEIPRTTLGARPNGSAAGSRRSRAPGVESS